MSQSMQRQTHKVPCSSMTSIDPAAWCSRSTFCVMRVNAPPRSIV
jgi:hypothetical protein